MVVLWSPRISQKAYIQAPDLDQNQIFDKVETANFYYSISVDGRDCLTPCVAGTFTDWKVRSMWSIARFCEKLLLAKERGSLNLKSLISRSQKKKLGLRQMAALDLKSHLRKSGRSGLI